MPTYQYACTVCEHGFEVVQSFTDDALTECPQCQGRLRKVFGSVGVVFKGSGFYRTDSRSNANGEPKGGDKGADKADKSEKTAKPEAKPAAKDSPGSAGSSSSTGSTGSTGKTTASSTAGSAA